MHWGNLTVVAGFGAFGLVGGLAGRLTLARLRRGTIVRRGWCELGGALACGLVGIRFCAGGMPLWWVPVPVALVVLAVPLVAVDLLHRRLPDALTMPAYGVFAGALTIAATVSGDHALLTGACAGLVVFGGAHLGVHALSPSSLGAGDVKLAGCLGAVLGAIGWQAMMVAICLSALVTGSLTLLGATRPALGWVTGVPHGPGLLAATWVVVLYPGVGLLA